MSSSNRSRTTDWQLTVEARARRVRAELTDLETVPGTERDRAAALMSLEVVDAALHARDRWLHAIASWWSGWHIERAWRALHEAEIRVEAAQPDLAGRLPGLRQRVASYLPEDDLRRRALESLQPSRPASSVDRAVVVDALRAAFDATDDAHGGARALRNKLIAAAVILFVINTALGVLGLVRAGFIPMCAHLPEAGEHSSQLTVCASGGRLPGPADIWLVQLVGAFGAIIAAVVLLTRRRPSLSPYVLIGYQALIKVLLGSALAVVGVLALSAGVAQGLTCITSQSALLLWSALLGYSQQVGTRLLDNYADRVMDQVRPLPETTVHPR
ncbi:hypothetical protein BC739_007247 [Kutzneria viridogrisea]|uniref:Uncharacterized protein n=2 Tax=Kutzneria TaxID=43356 RepID=W5VZK0_9PSEU|nr:hypothetical protein [Kutzneria albida]AHH94348.1 hypothetical protein KALB_975 [Kutzneria albida DSM 43870]MBA8930014.1 hypothetical protein [Kutzneria viridogrisea]